MIVMRIVYKMCVCACVRACVCACACARACVRVCCMWWIQLPLFTTEADGQEFQNGYKAPMQHFIEKNTKSLNSLFFHSDF